MSVYTFTATVTSEDGEINAYSQPFTVGASPHVGATVQKADYSGATSFFTAAQTFDTNTGRTPMAANWQKVYIGSGSSPQFPVAANVPPYLYQVTSPTGLINNGVNLWLCYQPSVPYSSSDAASLVASILAFQGLGWTGKICLIQEPQDPAKGLSASTYVPAARSYYSYLNDPVHGVEAGGGDPVTVVYDAASNQGESAVATWYPGDAYCDEVAQDLYAETYYNLGVTLGTLQGLANNAKPNPKPMNLGEFASSLTTTLPTNANVEAFIQYVQGVFTSQVNNGYQIGQVMYYNGDNNTTQGYWNIINSSGDFRVPYLQALYDALNF